MGDKKIRTKYKQHTFWRQGKRGKTGGLDMCMWEDGNIRRWILKIELPGKINKC